MSAKSQEGFILLFALIITLVLSWAIIAAVRFGSVHQKLMDDFIDIQGFERRANEAANSAFMLDAIKNGDSRPSDALSCSGGTVLCTASGASCPGQWIAGADGIDDSCNNDDYLPSYFLPSSRYLLNPASNGSDGDDQARFRYRGYVAPGESSTTLVLNDRVASFLIGNPHNTYEGAQNFGSGQTAIISWSFSMTGARIYIDRIDRAKWRDTGRVERLSTATGTVLATRGQISSNADFVSWGVPFAFDGTSLSYVIRVENPLASPLAYSLETRNSQGIPIYSVPLDDSVDPWRYLYTECPTENWKYYCRERYVNRAR